MGCQEEILITKISHFCEQISSLDSLEPSHNVDTLLTQLVLTCLPPSPIDVNKLDKKFQEMRSKLIRLCGEAEGLLESHFSTIIGAYENPTDHLNIFPYYSNYLKLCYLEFTLLKQHYTLVPSKVAFVGSGPLPLTSIVLASKHLTTTSFHNYDLDPSANSKALSLVSSHPDLSKRMFFHTTDVMDVTDSLMDFDVVFLAALVGMDEEEKLKVIDHLAKYMAPGAFLIVRSAHGARAFLYPVVDPSDLPGFDVLCVFHPTDEVVNSIIIARKYSIPVNSFDHQQGLYGPKIMHKCTCARIHASNPMVEELAIEECLCLH